MNTHGVQGSRVCVTVKARRCDGVQTFEIQVDVVSRLSLQRWCTRVAVSC